MGVVFISCDRCTNTFYDGGDYVRCNENCEHRWCDMQCAEADGFKKSYYDEKADGYIEKSCNYCREDDVEDILLLKFLLKKYKLTRKKAVKMYFSKDKEPKE